MLVTKLDFNSSPFLIGISKQTGELLRFSRIYDNYRLKLRRVDGFLMMRQTLEHVLKQE
jgi:hypothetical protein